MKPIRRRQDVIDIAAAHAPTNACVAVMASLVGTTLLGSFTDVDGYPGWIVQVVSPMKRVWNIAILIDELDRKQIVMYINDVPWETWAGDSAGKNQLRDGDIPKIAAFKRMKANATTSIRTKV